LRRGTPRGERQSRGAVGTEDTEEWNLELVMTSVTDIDSRYREQEKYIATREEIRKGSEGTDLLEE
jgi:hypothetical protein